MRLEWWLAAGVVTAAPLAGQERRPSEASPPIVAGYEHLRASSAASESAMGEVLLGELNCLS